MTRWYHWAIVIAAVLAMAAANALVETVASIINHPG